MATELDAAMKDTRDAYEFFEASADEPGLISVSNTLGMIHARLGDYPIAIVIEIVAHLAGAKARLGRVVSPESPVIALAGILQWQPERRKAVKADPPPRDGAQLGAVLFSHKTATHRSATCCAQPLCTPKGHLLNPEL